VPEINPGYYNIGRTDDGRWFFKNIDVNLEGMVEFDGGVSQQVFDQIKAFWNAEAKFRKINEKVKVIYKRGMLLYGPPGCGKSSLISMVMKKVVDSHGIALEYQGSMGAIEVAIKLMREIHPDKKIVVVMEDIDNVVNSGRESEVINALDGVNTVFDNVIFLATTNYFERIPQRMLRPSRFDMKIKLDFPDAGYRRKYMETLLGSHEEFAKFDLDAMVKDSEGFSFADLKEIFISTCVFGFDYKTCIEAICKTKGQPLKNRFATDGLEKSIKDGIVRALKMEAVPGELIAIPEDCAKEACEAPAECLPEAG
jgi:hypothetical protein